MPSLETVRQSHVTCAEGSWVVRASSVGVKRPSCVSDSYTRALSPRSTQNDQSAYSKQRPPRVAQIQEIQCPYNRRRGGLGTHMSVGQGEASGGTSQALNSGSVSPGCERGGGWFRSRVGSPFWRLC